MTRPFAEADFSDLRILYSNPLLAAGGGPAAHGMAFISAARGLGASVYPVGGGRMAAKAFAAGAARVKRGSGRRWSFAHEIVRLSRNGIRDVRNAAGLARKQRDAKCNVVLARTTPVDVARVLIALSYGLPVVLEVNAPMAIELGRVYRNGDLRLQAYIEEFAWRRAARIVVVSNELRDILVGKGIDPQRVRTASNGTDTDLFSPTLDAVEVRERLGIRRSDFVVGFVGGLMPWHGVQTLFAAVSLLSGRENVKCLVIGGADSDSDRLTALASKAGVRGRVVWLPNQPQETLPGLLAACDVCTAPYAEMRPFYFSPLKVFEYMAMERAVIASAQGQLLELLGEGRGVLVPPDDPEALAARIASLQDDPVRRAGLGKMAREWVTRNATWTHSAATVLSVCREAIREKWAI